VADNGERPLKDTRHERFCQELVKGIHKREAAALAGFKASGSHVQASRLLSNVKIQNRIAWLQAESAAKSTITRAEGTLAFLRIAREAESQKRPAALSVATTAIYRAMEVNGLVVHKSESVDNGPKLTHAERRELIEHLKQQISAARDGGAPGDAPARRADEPPRGLRAVS
jgi:Terminase small subunit